jgi:hypothetical protein
MPSANQLPKSISGLARINARRFQWDTDVAALRVRIQKIAGERATVQGAKIDLAEGMKATGSVIVRAMELSLRLQGNRITLDPDDLSKQVRRATGRPLKKGVIFPDLIYVIDHMGVRSRGTGGVRYSARSYPLRSVEDVPAQLKMRRPVLTGVTVSDSWSSENISKSGIVAVARDPGLFRGGLIVALVGYDPATAMIRFLTPWPTWGDNGYGWLTKEAAAAYIHGELRSIEVTRMMDAPSHLTCFSK